MGNMNQSSFKIQFLIQLVSDRNDPKKDQELPKTHP